MSLTLTADQFRNELPEFIDTTLYPDSLVSAWLGRGATFINEDRWGTLATIGAELVAAHFLILAQRDQRTPGAVQGVTASKSVADLSVSYDVSAFLHPADGFWNMTSYGIRYANLRRMMGAGGLQLI